jgi:YHS domain-containing protein
MSEHTEHGHGHGHGHGDDHGHDDQGHDHGHGQSGHGAGHGHGHGHATATTDLSGHSSDEIAECLVMPGTMVVKAEAEAAGLYRDYEGQRYWFCCAACGPLWDADPARYANA